MADWACFANVPEGGDVATIQCLEVLFTRVVTAVVELAGVLLFIMLLVGGFTFLFSGGDQKKLETARGTITNAIIGLVIIVSAYLILKTISTFTGIPDLLQFKIPST